VSQAGYSPDYSYNYTKLCN